MKLFFGLISICVLVGCALPQVQPSFAPEPTQQEITQAHAVQTRTISIGQDSLFPKVLDVLMDNGFLVRSANEKLGVVSFYQQWRDNNQYGAIIIQEGSILFKPISPTSTQVRAMITQSWQRLEVSGGGKNSTDTAMIGGAKQQAEPEDYKKLLDLLEKGLCTPSK